MGSAFCLFTVIICLVGLFVVANNSAKRETDARARLQAAHDTYQDSLKKLKAYPSNADLKQEALRLGREYSALSRENKAVTTYDELALSNDISAATAGATIAQVPAQQSVEQRLLSLNELRVKGLISDDEYTARRRLLINEV